MEEPGAAEAPFRLDPEREVRRLREIGERAFARRAGGRAEEQRLGHPAGEEKDDPARGALLRLERVEGQRHPDAAGADDHAIRKPQPQRLGREHMPRLVDRDALQRRRVLARQPPRDKRRLDVFGRERRAPVPRPAARLAQQRGEIGAAGPGQARRERGEVEARRGGPERVAQDRGPPRPVRQAERELQVEAPGAGERRVDRAGEVGGPKRITPSAARSRSTSSRSPFTTPRM